MEEQTPQPEPPPRPARKRRRRGPSPAQIRRRQFFAVLILTAIIVFCVIKIAGSLGGDSEKPKETPVPADAAKAAKGLSTDEKIDAVFIAGFSGSGDGDPRVAKSQGGVVIEPENWPGASGAPSLTSAIHDAGALAVGVQEGGQFRAYSDLPPSEDQLALGGAGDPAAAQASSEQAAKALKKAGFDLNLAPVADVGTATSPVSARSYGDEPQVVSQMTAAAIEGCKVADLLCAPSHFPGLGAANTDTGNGPATVSLDEPTLLDRDIRPFDAAFRAGAPAVVLSHAFYAAYDAVTPGDLTEGVVTGLLRGKLGFKGAAITDDLSAGAIRGGVGAGDAAVSALEAGADLLLVSDPGDAAAARGAVAKAVADGDISQDRLDEAVGRVLALKKAAGLDISS